MLLLLALYQGCEWLTERLWFASLGYGAQFERLFLWRAGTFVAGAAIFALWLGFNTQVAWRNAAQRAVPLSFFQNDDGARLIPLEDKLHLDRYRRRATVGILVLLSWMAGLGFSARYLMFVRAFSTIGTGQRDSASNFDLAFFLFALPFYHWLSRFLLGAIVTALLLVTSIYLYEETIGAPVSSGDGPFSIPKTRAARGSRPATKHLAILWATLLLWKGVDCLLSVPLSFVSGGNVAARVFDPVDIRLGWTSAALFALSAPLVALLSGLSIAREPRYRTFALGVLWMVCAGAFPFFLPLVTARNPADGGWKSALSRHIQSTRRAWGLNDVERRSLALAGEATFRAISPAISISPSISPAVDTISAPDSASPLPLWPASAARSALNAHLSARGLDFQVTQVFLERVGNSLRYIGVAAPPIGDAARPSGEENSWRARYARAPLGLIVQMDAARTSAGGAPIFLPDLTANALLGAAPAATPNRQRSALDSAQNFDATLPVDSQQWIFTGVQSDDASQINEDERATSDNSLRGDLARGDLARGVSLGGIGARWLLAARFLEPQLARAANANDQITWYRGAGERCRAIAPFLDWRDGEARPLLLSSAGQSKNAARRLIWLVPGLVWSDDHPDSATPAAAGTAPPGVNYGRHIAVGAVDASSGAVTLYTLDEEEPFMALYNRAFPGLFLPPTSLPNPIRAALRPSRALLNAQTLIWARYHHQGGDQTALDWAAQRDNYRPLLPFDGTSELRPLAAQAAGDWLCIAYARPVGQVGSGGVSPLVSIFGADERDFASRGARARFVEWKTRAPLTLPDLLVESPARLLGDRPTPPVPTLLGIGPRFDAKNNAIGLVATRGEAKTEPPTEKTGQANEAAPEVRLKTEVQINGAATEEKNAPFYTESLPQGPSQVAQNLQIARDAWRDLRLSRQKGDWEAVSRAEKRLDGALSLKTP